MSLDRSEAELSGRIVFASAIVASACGILYLLGVIVAYAQSGSGPTPSGSLRIVSALIAIAWNPALLVLFVALRSHVPQPRRVVADIAAVFFVLLCVTSSINWFTQLTAARRIDAGGNAALVSLVDPFDPRSLMFAVEQLGWGWFLGLGCLFAAWAFAGRGLERGIRVLLGCAGVLALVHTVGLFAGVSFMRIFGYVSWALFVPASTVLIARWSRSR
jgi:hypothetical protein